MDICLDPLDGPGNRRRFLEHLLRVVKPKYPGGAPSLRDQTGDIPRPTPQVVDHAGSFKRHAMKEIERRAQPMV
jgi:hypothetical protein